MPEAEPTEEALDVPSEFRKVRTRQMVVVLAVLLIYMPLVFIGIDLGSCAIVVIAFVVLPVSVVLGLLNYRCPSCGGYPGRGFLGYPRHCQNCGVSLYDEN